MEPISKSELEKLKVWLGSGSINVFGIQFSGKDTQARKLADLLNAATFGGGDIIRHSNNEAVKKIIVDGNLAPQDAYLQMVLPFFSKDEFKNRPLVLSAVGRWQGEEKSIMRAAQDSAHPLKAVVLLSMPEAEVWRRFEVSKTEADRGERKDDTEQGIKMRLAEFKNKTLPVIDFYRQKNLLIEVDGTKSRESVTTEILTKLLEIAK